MRGGDGRSANFSTAILDAFGRMRVAQPTVVFTSTSGYDTEPLIWQTLVSGAGATATHNATTRAVDLTLSATTGYVVRQTYQYTPYQPGRSQFVTMTGILGAAVANVTKRIGQFDAKNGLFFELAGDGTKRVVRRLNGTDTAVDQSSWNLDPLNGNGSSGLTIDWTKDQIFVIDYAWLGTARVRWGFYLNGEIRFCHEADHANVLTTSYMQTAFLPLRYELRSTSAATATITQVCTAIASEGGYFDVPGYQFSAIRRALISVASEQCLVAIRPALTLNSIGNRAFVRVTQVEVTAATQSVSWALYYYPPGSSDPTTGGSWAQATGSSVEAKIGATAFTLGTPYTIAAGFSVAAGAGPTARGGTTNNLTFNFPLTLDAAGASSPITTNDGANPAYLVLAALTVSGAAEAAGEITWEEIR